MTSTNQLPPVHPGEILREAMNVRDLSADALAEALVKLTTEQRRDLLEILEDRHGARATLATSQLPVEKWHAMIGDPTLADAILDRLVHNAYKINLKGESMRKQKKH